MFEVNAKNSVLKAINRLDSKRKERIVIKDNKERSMVSIVIKNKRLYCEYDQAGDCDHIRFSNLLDEIKKLRKSGKLSG